MSYQNENARLDPMPRKRTYQPLLNSDLGTFVLALPAALAFLLALKILSLFVKVDKVSMDGLPPNALLYGTHLDVISACLCPAFYDPSAIVIGYDGFLPYMYTLWHRLVGISYLCYARASAVPPIDQILDLFAQYKDHRFWIFTDSGGPYGRVRKSLVILSVESRRPVVAMKLRPTRYFHLFGHRIPAPFSTIHLKFSSPIPSETLALLSPNAARDRLQNSADSL